jgi:hypothetical protein
MYRRARELEGVAEPFGGLPVLLGCTVSPAASNRCTHINSARKP